MSKSLKRVTQALTDAGLGITPIEMDGETRTAQQAADHVNCTVDQIAKSIIFKGSDSGALYLFVTAGNNRVDGAKASLAAGEPLERADGNEVRKVTGFAIGGVSPVGHLTAPKSFFDPHLLTFDTVWAAGGTPRHMFEIKPDVLKEISASTEAEFTE